MSDKARNKPRAKIRLEREIRTIRAMITIYCRDRHAASELCPDCRELLDYAAERIHKCAVRPRKPVCSLCSIHCYKPAMREKVRDVMRYAGPRMLTRHPILALRHWAHKILVGRK